MMTSEKNGNNLLSNILAVRRLLDLVKEDLVIRSELGSSRKVQRLPFLVTGNHGHQGQCYNIIQIDPETHFATLIDVHMAGLAEVQEGIKALDRVIQNMGGK